MAKERPYDGLWYSSPIHVFEKARDAASDAIDVATTLIQLAQQYQDQDPNTTISAICRNHKTVVGDDYSDLLSNAIHRCQSLLDNTPIKRFLEQYEKPISLETLQPDAKGRCTASSYHHLALAVTCQLSESIVLDLSVADYLNSLRYVTAAGNWIPDHVANIKSYVACESGTAIRAWQKDGKNPMQPTGIASLPGDLLAAQDAAIRLAGLADDLRRTLTRPHFGEIAFADEIDKDMVVRWFKLLREKQLGYFAAIEAVAPELCEKRGPVLARTHHAGASTGASARVRLTHPTATAGTLVIRRRAHRAPQTDRATAA